MKEMRDYLFRTRNQPDYPDATLEEGIMWKRSGRIQTFQDENGAAGDFRSQDSGPQNK
jgi:hypothetical protein